MLRRWIHLLGWYGLLESINLDISCKGASKEALTSTELDLKVVSVFIFHSTRNLIVEAK
jgi:hypothetical protein